MVKKKRNLAISISLIILLIITNFFLIAGYSWVNENIIKSSAISVKLVCNPEKAEEEGLKPAAETRVNTTTGEISVTFFVEPDEETLKHEKVHINQNQRKFTFPNTCGIGSPFKFLREMEAYIGDELPLPVFEKIYGEIPDFPEIINQ